MQSGYEDFIEEVKRRCTNSLLLQVEGRVVGVQGTLIVSRFPQPRIGDLCEIQVRDTQTILSEVIAFEDGKVWLSSLNPVDGIQTGAVVLPLYLPHRITVKRHLLGSILDGFGRSMEGKEGAFSTGNLNTNGQVDVLKDDVDPTSKPRIVNKVNTGIKAIDGLIMLGEGQRVGLFAGAGCGKTTLIAEVARGIVCDVIVFGLIGERGRELNEFIEHELDDQLRSRTVLVCATSDRSSTERARAAFTATAIAEAFRDQGMRVLLLIDSLTRFARAQREIGLAAGEPPGRGGFPPSVAALMPRLLERAGPSKVGSITAIYTVLIEQDSMTDPVADEARSLLDGHIILSRKLADKGHYPAIDVLPSLSRTMSNVADDSHMASASAFREKLAAYKEIELLLKLGEYQSGADPLTDLAVKKNEDMMRFLQQGLNQHQSLEDIVSQLDALA
ncbi:FliI/YscN family ATPase [Vibrio lentus]|uniref:protein-secreting ATPase n=1 Tax=Vibrio lentus TaxID=136468 RepID=A0AB36XGR0_9VIBR|nr:FliI/YscN family ATPase [Vibrio lentus]MCC4839600.1 FliI/YscN family ATPase [Vibrio lentus]PMI13278.1 flagellum-specific ATP synthase FliI [Vibrio lentus]PMK31271.1 flagellum-specific ATP synthase FliI [Vibrio lentus]PMK41921.1 flagellum-specific ATP synthase FliI [Vibrio lentus]PML34298.1 flagellum-specific ATP synthase FliI [Vibrio lentus]